MNLTPDMLEIFCEKHEKECAKIRRDRGEAYGLPWDTLANIRPGGWQLAAGELLQCAMRLVNMSRKSTVDEKKLRDASRDATNYSHYVEGLYDRIGESDAR